MYTRKARQLRRCKARCRDGRRCRQFACWADPAGRCRSHGGRYAKPSRRTRFVPCDCGAYAWPHRPGGGLCRWPDPPLATHPAPAGTHAANRVRPMGMISRIAGENCRPTFARAQGNGAAESTMATFRRLWPLNFKISIDVPRGRSPAPKWREAE